MKRREFVEKAGTAGVVGLLAGCSENNNNNPEEQTGEDFDDVNTELSSTETRELTESETQKTDYPTQTRNQRQEPTDSENPPKGYEHLASRDDIQGGPHFGFNFEYEGVQYEFMTGNTEEQVKEKGHGWKDGVVTGLDCESDVSLEFSGGGESTKEILSGPDWYSEVQVGDALVYVERTDCEDNEALDPTYAVDIWVKNN